MKIWLAKTSKGREDGDSQVKLARYKENAK